MCLLQRQCSPTFSLALRISNERWRPTPPWRIPCVYSRGSCSADDPGLAGSRPLGHDPLLMIGAPCNGEPHAPGNGQMVAFVASSREMVDRSYATALANGGASEGAPALQAEYHENYYGAYMRDTDVNKLCVVRHAAPPWTD